MFGVGFWRLVWREGLVGVVWVKVGGGCGLGCLNKVGVWGLGIYNKKFMLVVVWVVGLVL